MRPLPQTRPDCDIDVSATGLGTLILLRRGQCTADEDGLFAGLLDTMLTRQGAEQMREAGEAMRSTGLVPDTVFSSELFRSQRSAEILAATHEFPLPIRDWRLNGRNWGALTGRAKAEVLKEVGAELFAAWHRCIHIFPPPMDDALYNRIAASAVFRASPSDTLTRTDSLDDVVLRVAAFCSERLFPLLEEGRHILVLAHGSSLRALCGVLDRLDDRALEPLGIPFGRPLVYAFDDAFHPTPPGGTYLATRGDDNSVPFIDEGEEA